jgi:glycerol uptake facilitator-like aquaporin
MTLSRRAAAELIGTALLVATVVGSGICATRLTDDVALQLLCNAVATGGVLVALILTFGPVSGAFNPVVTLAFAALGKVAWRDVPALASAQVGGAAAGAVAANLMFGLSPVAWSTTARASGPHLLAELVATLGLLLVVLGGQRLETTAVAVAGFITGAYFFTSSTSFANPAVTIGRMLSDTFAGIAPSSVPGFVLAQVAGLALALGAVTVLRPVEVPS